MPTHKDTDRFTILHKDFEAAYVALHHSGELQQRARAAIEGLKHCTTCPRHCEINRHTGKHGVCRTGRYAIVSSACRHMGEENCLRGWHGSGTIFFAQCNLRCIFCQNYDISHTGKGHETTAEQLAELMLGLQQAGCHNINFVTPSHVVPQILEALVFAVDQGLHLPLVYNTSAYDALETLQLLDGVIDIYMPDFKFWEVDHSLRYLKVRGYPEHARAAIKEMHRQVGELKFDETGLALRGVLVRHLVMPQDTAGTHAIMRFLADELSPDTYVNIMAQYHPDGKVASDTYPEINRRITASELKAAYAAAQAAGITRLDER